MKVKFWKHKFELFVGGSVSIILSFATTIVGIIFTIKLSLWPILVAGIIVSISTAYVLFFQKRILSKIVFSVEGIEWYWLNNKILNISWHDVTNVKATPRARGVEDLSFVAGDKQIDVSLTKKMYNTIMILCPQPNIKFMINNIDCFKCYHRDK